jgi:thiosulfate/3-mercaptopyruvate sulfurtransferase
MTPLDPAAQPVEAPLRDPDALISTDDLAARLAQPGLRLYDCTTHLEPPDPGSDDPYKVIAGSKTFVAGHIPGADFLDLQGEFSASDTRLKFMMPPAEHLARAFGRHGLGDGSRVVLYSIGSMMWATRFWWMLRALGFDTAAVLDGGFDRWQAEGRAIGPAIRRVIRRRPSRRPARGASSTRPRFSPRSAIGGRSVNALRPSPTRVSSRRPTAGPAACRDRSTCRRRASSIPRRSASSPGRRLARFAAAGIDRDRRVIAYCGGISATIDLFVLHQLGPMT